MISLDARSGYHQICVRESDQEKLVFFTPSGTKKKFRVMPFGPKNVPAFLTAMIQSLRTEWLLLFADTKHVILCDHVLMHLSVMIRLSLMLFYSILTMSLHFFTIFLVLPKCLRNITCHLN